MRLIDQDEEYFRQLCFDMGFDMGFEVARQGGEAIIRMMQKDAPAIVVARPTDDRFFWEETFYALRRDYWPKAPARVARP